MTTYKSIAYAYATSPLAKHLGFENTGCFYVNSRAMNEAGEWYAFQAAGVEGFLNATHPDLISIFMETDGDIDPMCIRFGNSEALGLIKERYAAAKAFITAAA